MTNVAEGFDCDSRTEFARFLGYARRSIVEVQSLLYTAQDVDYIDEETFNRLYRQCTEAKRLVGALLHSLRRRPS